MNNKLQESLGAWVQAIGTIIAAIIATPSYKLSETLQSSLSLVGNSMQAAGNALLADAVKNLNLEKIGNSIQAIGNLTIVSGILLRFHEKTEIELDIKGDLLQALGSLLSRD